MQNNPGPVPPSLPPVLQNPSGPPGVGAGESTPPLAEAPPIRGLGEMIEAILRRPRQAVREFGSAEARLLVPLMVPVIVLCALAYGFIVGSFAGGDQLWAAPLKVAVGMLGSTLICLPSLYVISCLSGSRARGVEVLGLLTGSLLLIGILLVGFAPIAWVFSQSTNSAVAMGIWHLMFAGVGFGFGLRFLRSGLSQFGGSRPAVLLWVVVFVLVTLQMTTALRPFLGAAPSFLPAEKKFFVTHWLEQLRKP